MGKAPAEPKKPKSLWRTIVTVGATIGATLAAVAALIDQSKTVGGFILERLEPLLREEVTVTVKLDPGAKGPLHVNIVETVDDSKSIAKGVLEPKSLAVSLPVPANGRYVLVWEGEGYEPASLDRKSFDSARTFVLKVGETKDVVVGEKTRQFQVLTAQEETTGAEVPTAPATATSLLASQAASDGSDGPPAAAGPQLFPELNRALSTVGLFEYGTTDCMTRAYVDRFDMGAGCFAASILEDLADVLKALDAQTPGLLDLSFGDDASFVRSVLAGSSYSDRRKAYDEIKDDRERQRRLRKGLAELAKTIEFRGAYQTLAADYYARAMRTARDLHLQSERGLLFVFDRLVQGLPWLTKVKQDYLAQEKSISAGDDRKRLELLRDLIKARYQNSPQLKWMAERIDTIVSGHGVIGGIDFDLDRIGIRYEVSIVAPVPVPQAPLPPAPSPQVYLVLFDYQSDKLTEAGSAVLNQVVFDFKANQDSRITLTGYTDRSGEASVNLELSQRMADAVKAALVAKGIDPAKIEVTAKGETEPAVPTADGVKEQANRRVEIILQPKT